MNCPYVRLWSGITEDNNNAVDMVWHDNECVSLNMLNLKCQLFPTGAYYLPVCVFNYLPFIDSSE